MLVGVADVALAVAADEALRGGAEDLLVCGDPADAVPGQERDHRLADRALGRPHARGPAAEQPLVLLDGPADVQLGVVGIAARVLRQADVGHGLAGQLLVEQQRQDGVIVRRRRQLDLARLGEAAVQRQDLPEDVEVRVEQAGLVGLAEVPALVAQVAQGVVVRRRRADGPRRG